MARSKNAMEKAFSFGRAAKGGRARAAALTPQQRSASARKAVNARWLKERAVHTVGTLSASIDPVDRAVIEVVITHRCHDAAPQISLRTAPWEATWHVHSHAYVMTQNESASYTQ